MPTLSASDYTRYLKFKAAVASPIRPAIQTRDNVSLSQTLINANLLASQAAFVTTPPTTTVTTRPVTVTDASTTTVTAARTDVITAATAVTNAIEYTTSQAHGLATNDVVTIAGLTQNTLSVTPNVTSAVVTVTTPTKFLVTVVGVTGTASGTGRIVGRVYYTTGVANGLLAGDVISITGITTFTASSRTVLAAPTATTFVLDSTTTGTAVSGQTGSITGLVYYTTSAPHVLYPGTPYVSITGLTGTLAYNQTLVSVYRVPSDTVFIVQSSATGTAVTGASGVLTVTVYANTSMALTSNARVQALQVPQVRSNPDARSTVFYAGTSGALGSSRVQRPGGLPTGFKSSTSTYTRLPQNAGW
jgi:hypothetical protein